MINEIMGIRDRAKSWLKNTGQDFRRVDAFVKSEPAVALVHDLANTDKHGHLDGPPFSGYKPNLVNVSRGMSLKYDPSTGTYAATGNYVSASYDMETGEQGGVASSSGLEVVLIGQIEDEGGNEIGELQKLLPHAIYKWEQFLMAQGLVLS